MPFRLSARSVFVCAGASLILACGGEGAPARADASAKSPIDAPFTLSGAEAVDPDRLLALIPEDARPTAENASFDEALGATVYENVSFTEDGGVATIDRVEVYGPNFDVIDAAGDDEKADAAGALATAVRKVRLFGVTLTPPPVADVEGGADTEADGGVSVAVSTPGVLRIGAIEIDALDVRPGAGALAEKDAANFANSFALGGFYAKDLALEGPIDDGAPADVALSIPDLRLTGVSGGAIETFIVNGLRVVGETDAEALADVLGEAAGAPAGGTQTTEIKTLQWRGLDFSEAVKLALKDEKLGYDARNRVSFGALDLKGVSSHIGDKLFYKSDAQSFAVEETAWLAPSKIRGRTEGDFYDFTAYFAGVGADEETLVAALKEQGLDAVTGAATYAYDWDADGGAMTFSAATDAENVAALDFDLALDGFELAKLGAAFDAGEEDAVAQLGKFAAMSMTLEDEKALDAIFAIAAVRMNTTGPELRESAPSMLKLVSLSAQQVNPKIGDYINAAAAFIGEGGTLRVKAAPENPVSFQALDAAVEAGPAGLPDLLNVSVTHDAPAE